jgi:4-amino-4-deoxy-L-arabinose transferase-like glycosyltransferase
LQETGGGAAKCGVARSGSAPPTFMTPSNPPASDQPTPRAPEAARLSASDAQTAPPASAAPTARYRLGVLGLLLVCGFAFFWRLGSVPLFDLDEALYVTCARQMVLTGDIVTPRLNSRLLTNPAETAVPFFEKPILVYWACAASMALFGLSEWAARLPVALAALLTTGLVAWAGTRWFGRRAGLLAGLVYALAPITVLDARQMTTDGLLVLWFTGAMLAFWHCHSAAQDRRPVAFRWPLLFWTACALAVLTKGAVGLLLPLLVSGVFLFVGWFAPRWKRRRGAEPTDEPAINLWASVRSVRPLAGLLLVVVLAAPWHIAIWRAGGRDAQGRTWVQEYILRQHVGRFRGLDTVHNAPPPTYFVYFLLGFFPWACFAPAAFRKPASLAPLPGPLQEPSVPKRFGTALATPRNRGSGAIAGASTLTPGPAPLQGEGSESASLYGVSNSRQSAEERQNERTDGSLPLFLGEGLGRGATRRFLLVWFWTIFVFFSVGAAKLPTYIAPAYPAAALLVGRWLDGALRSSASARTLRSVQRGALGALATAAFLAAVAVFVPPHLPPRAAIPASAVLLIRVLTLLMLAGCLIAWLCLLYGRGMRWRWGGLGALLAVPMALVGIGCTLGYAMARRDLLGPYQQLAVAARPDAEKGLPVVFYNIIPRRPSMLYYARYAPLERKERPLLPFLRPFLQAEPHEADVVLPVRAWKESLRQELAAAPEMTARVLKQTGGEREGWVLLRILYHVPPQTRADRGREQPHG